MSALLARSSDARCLVAKNWAIMAGMKRSGELSRADVARMAGVSPRTVSNVVNGYAHVSPETRKKVQTVIDALGYRANAAARTLRTGRTGIIGLVVPALDQPYFAGLTRAIIREAGASGYTVVVDQTEGDRERERALLRGGPLGAVFDGLILSPLALTPEDLLDSGNRGDPVVLLGEREVRAAFDHVLIDNVAAAREATEHLIAIGRRHLAAIGLQEPDDGHTSSLRKAGFLEAVAAAGRRVELQHLRRVDKVLRASGYEQMLELLDCDPRPDAVFCFTDLMAVGALRACYVRGVKVPDEVAIIGFDDVEEASFTAPSLSTVRPDIDAIARIAVARLLARIEGGDGAPGAAEAFTVAHELVVRESTAGPAADAPPSGVPGAVPSTLRGTVHAS